EWDGWPDGDFSGIFSLEFAETHDNLGVHWACAPLGGSSGGSAQAETWPEGKITRRRCQGIIECGNRTCRIIIRPQTRPAGIQKQLSVRCSCGGELTHHTCDVTSVLHTFKHGIHYHNGVGRPGVHGPGESVADITPLLYNTERIKYERRKILQGSGGNGNTNFMAQFSKFEQDHPEFIRDSQFGKVAVIVMQTPFMASKLVKATIEMEAVNGIVSDAAHGVWRDKNSLLIVSSTFEPDGLKCWVPGLMSYANGGTAEHYRIHFFNLFLGIAEECASRELEVTDALFANVVDFSTAERNGFILAYVDFWLQHASNARSIDELCDAAPKLLKGCEQHFRNQITRVKKISGVVDPSKRDI
ncbi:hypothetical protein B0H17DRAFT_872502, partial [Mycena rosella]